MVKGLRLILSRRESLYIWRRRCGYSQKEAAYVLGVGYRAYIRYERGSDSSPFIFAIGELSIGEKLVILRRRHRMTTRDVSLVLKCSRALVDMQEKELRNPEKLVALWDKLLQNKRAST